MRMTITDDAAESATLTNLFTVSIGHKCSDNLLGYTTKQDDLIYDIPYTGDGTTCVDMDFGLFDANGASCADYTSSGGAGAHTCDGTNDGTSGFDASAMCCQCTGGYITAIFVSGPLTVSILDTPLSGSVDSCLSTCGDCPHSCSLQIFNPTSDTWQTYQLDVTPSYINNWDSQTCGFDFYAAASDGPTYSPAGTDP